MITWQDPVALGLAVALVASSLWWRRWLIRRGAAPHCVQCTADNGAAPDKAARPTVVEVGKLRLSRPR